MHFSMQERGQEWILMLRIDGLNACACTVCIMYAYIFESVGYGMVCCCCGCGCGWCSIVSRLTVSESHHPFMGIGAISVRTKHGMAYIKPSQSAYIPSTFCVVLYGNVLYCAEACVCVFFYFISKIENDIF